MYGKSTGDLYKHIPCLKRFVYRCFKSFTGDDGVKRQDSVKGIWSILGAARAKPSLLEVCRVVTRINEVKGLRVWVACSDGVLGIRFAEKFNKI
jgi:hypothetical protein